MHDNHSAEWSSEAEADWVVGIELALMAEGCEGIRHTVHNSKSNIVSKRL